MATVEKLEEQIFNTIVVTGKLAPEKLPPEDFPSQSLPWVRVRGWFRVRVGCNIPGAIFQEAIFLVPTIIVLRNYRLEKQ